MTIWGHACCWWYGVQARWEGLRHLLRGHDLRWRDCPEIWIGITGCINCYECPDTEDGVGLAIWIRESASLRAVAQWLCGRSGHRERVHPIRGSDDSLVLDKWYCTRCLADVEAP